MPTPRLLPYKSPFAIRHHSRFSSGQDCTDFVFQYYTKTIHSLLSPESARHFNIDTKHIDRLYSTAHTYLRTSWQLPSGEYGTEGELTLFHRYFLAKWFSDQDNYAPSDAQNLVTALRNPSTRIRPPPAPITTERGLNYLQRRRSITASVTLPSHASPIRPPRTRVAGVQSSNRTTTLTSTPSPVPLSTSPNVGVPPRTTVARPHVATPTPTVVGTPSHTRTVTHPPESSPTSVTEVGNATREPRIVRTTLTHTLTITGTDYVITLIKTVHYSDGSSDTTSNAVGG
jgi:hypothetical protein